MTTNFSETAKIYTFPRRGRFAINNQRDDAAAAAQLSRGAKLAVGSAWYHDEAIREAGKGEQEPNS
jgi:hypothetical protein